MVFLGIRLARMRLVDKRIVKTCLKVWENAPSILKDRIMAWRHRLSTSFWIVVTLDVHLGA
jgi:hypothetical protein